MPSPRRDERRFRPLRRCEAPHRNQSVTSVADGVYGVFATRLAVMASKTVTRTGTRTSRSKAGSRSGARPARPALRRKPARRRTSGHGIAAAGVAVGRGARAGWLMLAKGAGPTARSVGRARDIEPGHQRDGIALALLGVAVVIAAGSWFDAARPVGQWIDTFLWVLIRSAALLLPVVLAAIAVVLMRTEPDPDARPRLVLGSAMIALPALGLWHLWSGSPQTPAARQQSAGFIGFAIGGPLSDGLTAWIAAPLLFIGVLFGLLLVTGTTIREVPSTVRAMFSTRAFRSGDDRYGYDQADEGSGEHAEDFSDGYYDDPSAYRDDEAQAWPSGLPNGTPYDHYPLEDEAPTIPEPTAGARSRRRASKPAGAAKAAKQEMLPLDRVVEGPHLPPSLDPLVARDPPKRRSSANDRMVETITEVLQQF